MQSRNIHDVKPKINHDVRGIRAILLNRAHVCSCSEEELELYISLILHPKNAREYNFNGRELALLAKKFPLSKDDLFFIYVKSGISLAHIYDLAPISNAFPEYKAELFEYLLDTHTFTLLIKSAYDLGFLYSCYPEYHFLKPYYDVPLFKPVEPDTLNEIRRHFLATAAREMYAIGAIIGLLEQVSMPKILLEYLIHYLDNKDFAKLSQTSRSIALEARSYQYKFTSALSASKLENNDYESSSTNRNLI